jgi:hypothetical protein
VKVRLYVEGGSKGTHANSLRQLKNGFKQHLLRLGPELRMLDVSPCGSTEETIRDYVRAVRECVSECIPVLLVDSDAPVIATPAQHLRQKLDSAKVPLEARQGIFLMVQCMEAWVVTDEIALERCFGSSAKGVQFPRNPDIEAVPKGDIFAALDSAARSMANRRYHKIRDGAQLLAEVRPERVASRSKHAQALHQFLLKAIRN